MGYFYVATSLAGFVQQLAVSYLKNGYWFYVAGEIPAHKDPKNTDRKIIEQYDIGLSKWARARRKKTGRANLQYLRHGRFYVILATHGEHAFFEGEKNRMKDARETPICISGYAIGYRRAQGGRTWHPSVRISLEYYRDLKAYFETLAVHRTVERLGEEFACVGFEPYAPVRNQLLSILRSVNQLRKTAGFTPVPASILPWKRVPVRALQKESFPEI